MNVQIFGLKKCFETKKAERYFKERNIKFQFVDLNEKGLSKGELQSVRTSIDLNDLINKEAKVFKSLNLDQIRSSQVREEILLNNPKLYHTPIVRNGKKATVGYQPDVWKDWD